jgi:hypothetical protein
MHTGIDGRSKTRASDVLRESQTASHVSSLNERQNLRFNLRGLCFFFCPLRGARTARASSVARKERCQLFRRLFPRNHSQERNKASQNKLGRALIASKDLCQCFFGTLSAIRQQSSSISRSGSGIDAKHMAVMFNPRLDACNDKTSDSALLHQIS